jgi:hypothetical protein
MAPNYGLQKDTSKIALKNKKKTPSSSQIHKHNQREELVFFLGFARKKEKLPKTPLSSSSSSSSSLTK